MSHFWEMRLTATKPRSARTPPQANGNDCAAAKVRRAAGYAL